MPRSGSVTRDPTMLFDPCGPLSILELPLASSHLLPPKFLAETLAQASPGYGTVDPDTETIRIERDWRAPGIPKPRGFHSFPGVRFRYIEDLKRGDTVVCSDAEQDIRTASTADALKLIGAHAFVNMPIMEHGKVVAIFFVTYASAHEWSEEELAFIRDVAERTRMGGGRRRSKRSLSTDLEVTRRPATCTFHGSWQKIIPRYSSTKFSPQRSALRMRMAVRCSCSTKRPRS